MAQQKISITWGKGELPLALPSSWKVRGTMKPASITASKDTKVEIRKSLANPIKTKTLSELAKGKKNVVVVIDDISRPTPVRLIMPAVMAELKKARITPAQVTVVPALGLHRSMPVKEVEARTGIKGLRVVNPECDALEKLVQLGATSFGSPVLVNKTVAKADLVISIGLHRTAHHRQLWRRLQEPLPGGGRAGHHRP